MKDLRQRLLATFQVEHQEHVQRIRESLASFESGAHAPDIDDVFRRAHSLKGAARAVDLRPLEALAHRMETVFARVREQTMPLDAHAIRTIHQALDASEDWLAASAGAEEPPPPAAALAAIDALLGAPIAAAAPPPPGAAHGSGAAHAEGAARADVAPRAAGTTTPASSAPSAKVPATVAGADTLRLNAASLDRIGTSAGQLLTESLRQDQLVSTLRDLSRSLSESARERDRVRQSGARIFQKLDSTPELAAVARYVNYIDHQIQRLTREADAATRLHARNAWSLRSLAGELQHDVRRARMVPAENVFDGFRKMVRDLARDAGKNIEMHVAGAQVEADRIVLQALRDPVMHMLRNAIDHGLETEADRVRRGKPGAGKITLTIEAHGNRLSVAVEDDGRGIDAQEVAKAAVRKGLIAEADAAQRAEADLMRLVLLPGFSTSRSVTDMSGRGMGLSVVAQAVARLQGRVEIARGTSGGTRVTISAPLSVSSHRVLLVRCGEQTLAVPLHGMERLMRVKVSDVRSAGGKPFLTVDQQAIPAVSLAHLLNAAEPRVSASGNALCVMVMEAGGVRLAVAVDAFVSERNAIVKDLPSPFDRHPQIAGGMLLEDGTICLVLNPAGVVEAFRQSSDALVLAADAAPPSPDTPSLEILVVDDSLTTRTLEKSVLEAHGYQVATAVDGMDALRYLRANHVRLVISDIEMPRLDGFGLLGEMKGDPRLAGIPVIIVSSVESPDAQARGLTLGADAYVVKRKFDQHELLETIRQIV